MIHFTCKTHIIAGHHGVTALADYKIQKLLMVTDPFFYENGTATKVAECAKAEKVAYFHKITPDPSIQLVAEGAAMVREFLPDTIVALGGGSAMDCAKAMACFGECPVKLIAIPTTSGSGSEVTDYAVLTYGGKKHPLVDESLRPDVAILDAELLKTLPAALIADSGFDVLAHAMEAYVATGAGGITDALAGDSFRCAFSALPASFAGDTSVRLQLHVASTMAGIAFSQAGLGLCHALSHSLGGLFHVPHGKLNAILLPSVMTVNAQGAGAKYARLAGMLGLGSSTAAIGTRNLKNALLRLRKQLQLPRDLKQAGILPEALWQQEDAIVAATLEDPCCRTNPVLVEGYMVRDILKEVADHG